LIIGEHKARPYIHLYYWMGKLRSNREGIQVYRGTVLKTTGS